MKVISGHQPAYLPWPGYFHKILLCDTFILMDDVQFIKRDWIHRNRIKGTHGEVMLTVPVKKMPTNTKINEVEININENWQDKHWKTIKQFYKNSPYFYEYEGAFAELYQNVVWTSLSDLCLIQLKLICNLLGIKTNIVMSSDYNFENKKDRLILEQCKVFKADAVLLGEKGSDYIDENIFLNENIKIYFQNYIPPKYSQRYGPFIYGLSVIDILFNVGPDTLETIMSGNINKRNLIEKAG